MDIPGKGNASSFGVQQQSYNVVVKIGLQSAASGGRWPAEDGRREITLRICRQLYRLEESCSVSSSNSVVSSLV